MSSLKKNIRDRYYWSAMMFALRRAGYNHKAIANGVGVEKNAVSNWAMVNAGRRPSDPIAVLNFAAPIIGPHMIRVCTRPEHEVLA